MLDETHFVFSMSMRLFCRNNLHKIDHGNLILILSESSQVKISLMFVDEYC